MVSGSELGTGPRGAGACYAIFGATCGRRVRILFDTNTPAPLAGAMRGHQVTHTVELRWQSLENGALLDAAEAAGFDVLVTCDQNVRYQQNFTNRKLALVILSTNHWPTLRPIAARIAAIVDFMQRGAVMQVNVGEL